MKSIGRDIDIKINEIHILKSNMLNIFRLSLFHGPIDHNEFLTSTHSLQQTKVQRLSLGTEADAHVR